MTSIARTIALPVLLIAALAAILSAFGVPYQFTLWEFYLDGKLLLLSAFLFVAWRRGRLVSPDLILPYLRFRWHHAVMLFFLPLIIYAVPIVAGMAGGDMKLTPMDNAATLILATVFDIPAIYVFSATTILLEEMIFRAYLPHMMKNDVTVWRPLISGTLLWTFYSVSEAVGNADLSIMSILSVIIWYSSIGLFCSVLAQRTGSVWPGYSFRTGVLSLTPIVLTSLTTESDPFFTASLPWFAAEGLIVSVIIVTIALTMARQIPQKMQNSAH